MNHIDYAIEKMVEEQYKSMLKENPEKASAILIDAIMKQDHEYEELQAENAKLKEIIKRFLVIAEALKGGCWE